MKKGGVAWEIKGFRRSYLRQRWKEREREERLARWNGTEKKLRGEKKRRRREQTRHTSTVVCTPHATPAATLTLLNRTPRSPLNCNTPLLYRSSPHPLWRLSFSLDSPSFLPSFLPVLARRTHRRSPWPPHEITLPNAKKTLLDSGPRDYRARRLPSIHVISQKTTDASLRTPPFSCHSHDCQFISHSAVSIVVGAIRVACPTPGRSFRLCKNPSYPGDKRFHRSRPVADGALTPRTAVSFYRLATLQRSETTPMGFTQAGNVIDIDADDFRAGETRLCDFVTFRSFLRRWWQRKLFSIVFPRKGSREITYTRITVRYLAISIKTLGNFIRKNISVMLCQFC